MMIGRLAWVGGLLTLAVAVCSAETWTDSFDYADGSGGAPNWEVRSVAWSVEGGRMTFAAGSKGFLLLDRLGYGRRVSVEATMTLTGRTNEDWAVAGLVLHYDDANHWHLALIESPTADGARRSVELVESYEGRWLANYEGDAKLPQTANDGAGWGWEYDRPYRLQLTVTPDGIEGTVSEMDGTLRRRLGWAFEPGRPAVTTGRAGLDAGARQAAPGASAWFRQQAQG